MVLLLIEYEGLHMYEEESRFDFRAAYSKLLSTIIYYLVVGLNIVQVLGIYMPMG